MTMHTEDDDAAARVAFEKLKQANEPVTDENDQFERVLAGGHTVPPEPLTSLKHVLLPESGAVAHVDENIQPETIEALDDMCLAALASEAGMSVSEFDENRVEIALTEQQLESIKTLCKNKSVETNGGQLFGVLGQAFIDETLAEHGEAHFYWLTHEQYTLIHDTVVRVRFPQAVSAENTTARLQAEVFAWCRETFTDQPLAAVFAHLWEELHELYVATYIDEQVEEILDCAMLTMEVASWCGVTLQRPTRFDKHVTVDPSSDHTYNPAEEFEHNIRVKLEQNKLMKWYPDENGVWHHEKAEVDS